jgi:hypothetical protein
LELARERLTIEVLGNKVKSIRIKRTRVVDDWNEGERTCRYD